MDILFLSDNFPPETNAPASRTFEHAKRWVAAGHRVTVVTTAPNFPTGRVHQGYRNSLWASETRDGVQVVRVWTYISANEGFVRRTADYLSFMLSSIFASVFLPRPDVVVATSPQFFSACAGAIVARFKRRPFVFELRDLWPDSIVAVGAMKETFLIRALRKLEYGLYKRASLIVSVTNSFKRILAANGVDDNKIVVVPNGVDLGSFAPGDKPPDLVSRFGVEGKFVASYIGTVGLAHGLGTLLDAAEILKSEPFIVFLVIGTGADKAALKADCARRGLENVIFVDPVPKEEVIRYWRLCDAALVLLKRSTVFLHVIPSKMFEAMRMRRPVILGVEGESAEILGKSGAGIAVEPESPRQLADAILKIARDRSMAEAMGRDGDAFVRQYHDRDVLARTMLDALEHCVIMDRK